MANIADNANIFTGPVLDLFNQMEVLVVRDGDVAGAKAEMTLALNRIISAQVIPAGTGTTYTRRKP